MAKIWHKAAGATKNEGLCRWQRPSFCLWFTLLPHLVPDPVFGVFLAEPVSDILAATITTITFFARFDKILDQGAARV